MTLDFSPEGRARARTAAERNVQAGAWVVTPADLGEGVWEEALHPRGRGGKFADKLGERVAARRSNRGQVFDKAISGLQDEWADLDLQLFKFVNDPTAPAATEIIHHQQNLSAHLQSLQRARAVERPEGDIHDVAVVGTGPAGLKRGRSPAVRSAERHGLRTCWGSPRGRRVPSSLRTAWSRRSGWGLTFVSTRR